MEVLLFVLFFISALIFFISGKDDFGRTESKIIKEDKTAKDDEKKEIKVEEKKDIEHQEGKVKDREELKVAEKGKIENQEDVKND